MASEKFTKLVGLFRILPGVGPRQAARFVLALREKPEGDLRELGSAIINIKTDLATCPECFNLSENGLCNICADSRRKHDAIMVVEKITDLEAVENTGLYRGLYHVLGGAINPVEGAGIPSIKLAELEQRVQNAPNGQVEVILATNPTTAGETTALYITERLKNKKGVQITRLARGLSSGMNLEYTDQMTLKHALEKRG